MKIDRKVGKGGGKKKKCFRVAEGQVTKGKGGRVEEEEGKEEKEREGGGRERGSR